MKMTRLIAALAAPLLLAACLLSPGKFESGLDIRSDGRFTFRYVGEIVVLDTSSNAAEFEPAPCYDAESGDPRECTETELAEQRAAFDESQQQAKQQNPADAMPGNLDSDEGIADFVAMLRKDKGWQKVEYRGDRIIDVEYAISGDLAHGFAFPLVEGGQAIFPFVTITPRADGTVKVVAPAFGGATGDSGGLAAMAAAGKEGKKQPKPNGVFTITTNGEVLTNNTDEGPSRSGGEATLRWPVNERSTKAPEALIQLSPR